MSIILCLLFLCLYSVLEHQYTSSLSSSSSHPLLISSSTSDSNNSNPISSSSSFTLKRLYVWIQDPLRRLSLMAELCESVYGLRGGALISVVCSHLSHGDLTLVSFIRRICDVICEPFFMMIRNWICNGELADTNQEFFIQCDQTVPLQRLCKNKKNTQQNRTTKRLQIQCICYVLKHHRIL